MSIREGRLIPSAQIEVDDTNFSIVAGADAHVGDQYFVKDLFEDYIKWILDDRNRFAIFVGDLYDLYCHHFVPAGMWEQILTPQQQGNYLRKTFRELDGKVLAMVFGNHEFKGLIGPTSIDPIEELCLLSGATNVGPGGYFLLDVTHPEGESTFVFALSHTLGGSRRKAYKLIQIVEQGGFDDAEIVLVGHQHSQIHIPFTRQRVRNRRYYYHRIDGIRCGTMLDYPDYALYKGLPPQQLGFPILDLKLDPKGLSVDLGRNNIANR